ncbi:MAG TPA: hypothetical protein VEA16_01525, partial [Vicinamibacterales bacterium]|nr:hypothetical protein [Vicinamibacterales bacterium]
MRAVCAIATLVVIVAAGVTQRSTAATIISTQGTRLTVVVTDQTPLFEQRTMISTLESMMASGVLRAVNRRDDPLAAGRTHERFQQVYAGIPVLGADVTVQRRHGQIVSALGTVFDGLALDTEARLPFAEIKSAMAANGEPTTQTSSPMFILPANDGRVSLVYAMQTKHDSLAYVDASSAATLLELTQRQTQAAVGLGTGTLGDTKKISTLNQDGTYVSQDALRPPALRTFDLQGNESRATLAAIGQLTLGTNDLARKADNVWTDGAVVDAHVHAGWVYDYYFRRFQRRGLDNNDVPILSIVHPALAQNARTAGAVSSPF